MVFDHGTQQKWDTRHAAAEGSGEVARVLAENQHLLPVSGKALDLACGRGANSLELARLGLEVTAWDISSVAIERLRGEASRLRLPVTAEVVDVLQTPLPELAFDVILVSQFLERALASAILSALKPGGLLFYQTFNDVAQNGPGTARFHLAEGELLQLFSPLKLRVYREERRLGNLQQGWRGMSMLIAEKSAV